MGYSWRDMRYSWLLLGTEALAVRPSAIHLVVAFLFLSCHAPRQAGSGAETLVVKPFVTYLVCPCSVPGLLCPTPRLILSPEASIILPHAMHNSFLVLSWAAMHHHDSRQVCCCRLYNMSMVVSISGRVCALCL